MGGFVQDFSEFELRNVGNGLCAVPLIAAVGGNDTQVVPYENQ